MRDGIAGLAPTTHALSTGELTLTIADQSRDGLFRIAERQNPKRAFLFVSTVLGRHIPVDPVEHRIAVETLADRVLPHLGGGPVMVMSYAETAIGLGLGVLDALGDRLGTRAMGYLPTTRFRPDGCEPWFTTREDHSHAVDHMIFRPAFGTLPPGSDGTLVLVDDETTTGKTFAGLAEGLKAAGLHPAHIVLVTLTDWSNGHGTREVGKLFPAARVASVALLSGSYTWTPATGVTLPRLPPACPPGCPAWTPAPEAAFAVPRRGLDIAAHRREKRAWAAMVADALLPRLAESARVLVVGTGEHVWHPFLASEMIAATGRTTRFIATTRSPVVQGAVVPHQITFPDHYGLGLTMYLNNVRPEAWDDILLFTETGVDGIPGELRAALGKGCIVTPSEVRTMAGDMV